MGVYCRIYYQTVCADVRMNFRHNVGAAGFGHNYDHGRLALGETGIYSIATSLDSNRHLSRLYLNFLSALWRDGVYSIAAYKDTN